MGLLKLSVWKSRVVCCVFFIATIKEYGYLFVNINKFIIKMYKYLDNKLFSIRMKAQIFVNINNHSFPHPLGDRHCCQFIFMFYYFLTEKCFQRVHKHMGDHLGQIMLNTVQHLGRTIYFLPDGKKKKFHMENRHIQTASYFNHNTKYMCRDCSLVYPPSTQYEQYSIYI